MKTFEPGKNYSCRSACDYECIFTYKIISRTAKTVTIEGELCGRVRRGVKLDHFTGDEYILPEGQYSMCPILRA